MTLLAGLGFFVLYLLVVFGCVESEFELDEKDWRVKK